MNLQVYIIKYLGRTTCAAVAAAVVERNELRRGARNYQYASSAVRTRTSQPLHTHHHKTHRPIARARTLGNNSHIYIGLLVKYETRVCACLCVCVLARTQRSTKLNKPRSVAVDVVVVGR